MRLFTFIMTTPALILIAAGPTQATCNSAQAVQVNALSGDPERDTFGLTCLPTDVDRTSSLSSVAHERIVQIGASTRDAEKDTFGYMQRVSAQ
jgi:hypothetical protein